ncbi:MAG TPA: alpha/beta fold hydrolase [Candidatus Dormibacteraeota bacterium]
MATYVLIPGGGGAAWAWHRVVPLLERRGHKVVAVDLPVSDPKAGYEEYVQAVLVAMGGPRDEVAMVATSLGGIIAPLVAERSRVNRIVLVNPMVLRPGETPGERFADPGLSQARAEHYGRLGLELPPVFDPREAFFHDFPPELLTEAVAVGASVVQRFDTLFSQPWPLPAWPRVPTRFLQGRDDRTLPLEFQRRIARELLGIEVEEMPGGHLLQLSRPEELVKRIEGL